MKVRILLVAALAAALATARAIALNAIDPTYSATAYYNAGSNNVVSFDWSDSGDLYTMTSDSGYFFGGFYRWSDGVTTELVSATTTQFAGMSVVAIGNSVFYNSSDRENNQLIYRYDPTQGSTSLASTTANAGLYKNAGQLFITGAFGWGPNHIFHSELDAQGNLLSNPATDLGETTGASGPLAFDAAGNLYYAPGWSDLTVYKWTAAEVAAALADPGLNLLSVDGHLWLDYTSLYGDVSGATSMLLDGDGNLLLTLTNFDGPSLLTKFGVDESGLYDGYSSTLFESDGRLGELRAYNGHLYLASGSLIYEVIPEPSALLLLALGLGGVTAFRFRKQTLSLGLAAALTAPAAFAGPYSQAVGDPDNVYDAPIPGFVGELGDGKIGSGNVVNPIFQGWATTIITYQPAPGVAAGWTDTTKALGPVTNDNFDIVSLGDLYDPANPPKVGGVAVNPLNTTDGYGFIGYDAPGFLTLGFEFAITNGVGADFAIFENGFISQYTTQNGSQIGKLFAELAYVEVSTNGVDFARFPSISLTPAAVGAYGTINPTDVFNLAGKHVNAYGESWGTPFDLDDLADDPLVTGGLLDLLQINYVRLVDIPGNGFFLDSEGNPIYDAWVTFGSGGLDFEALGVIHQIPEPSSMIFTCIGIGGGLLAFRKRLKRAA